MDQNPSDYFMNLLSEETYLRSIKNTEQNAENDKSKTYEEFIKDLNKKYEDGPLKCKIEKNPDIPELTDSFIAERKYTPGWCEQFTILFQRCMLNQIRLLGDNIIRLAVIVIFGLFMLALYTNIPNYGYVAFQNRMGALFMVSTSMVMGALNNYSIMCIF